MKWDQNIHWNRIHKPIVVSANARAPLYRRAGIHAGLPVRSGWHRGNG